MTNNLKNVFSLTDSKYTFKVQVSQNYVIINGTVVEVVIGDKI